MFVFTPVQHAIWFKRNEQAILELLAWLAADEAASGGRHDD